MTASSVSFSAAFRVLLIAGVIVAVIAGLIGIGSPSAALLSVPGIVLGAVSALTFGRFWPGVAALLVLCVITWSALLVFDRVWLSAVIMGLIGFAQGLSSRTGLHSIALNIAIFGSSAFFAVVVPVGQVGTMAGATSTAAAILAGGVISLVVFLLIGRGKTLPRAAAYSWPDTIVHTTALSVTLFTATAIVLSWDRTPVSAWLLVTIIVLSQPNDEVTVRRSVERVLGTLAGAMLAGLIAIAVSAQWLLITLALICLVFAWSYRLSHPAVEQGCGYWVYALIWTPAMVIIAVPQGGSATLNADFARVVFTIAAAVSVVVVTYAARRFVRLKSAPRRADGTGA